MKEVKVHISVFDLAGGKSILTGSLAGRKVLSDLIGTVQPEASGKIVFLDFAGVEVATYSFLRECVSGFRDFARTRQRSEERRVGTEYFITCRPQWWPDN